MQSLKQNGLIYWIPNYVTEEKVALDIVQEGDENPPTHGEDDLPLWGDFIPLPMEDCGDCYFVGQEFFQ